MERPKKLKQLQFDASVPEISISKIRKKEEIPSKDQRRRLTYFGHKDDGQCTLIIRSMKIPTFRYNYEQPTDYKNSKHPADESKTNIFRKLRVKCDQNLDRFLVAPQRKNVSMGGIRSQCEGVLTAKSYKNTSEDHGAYVVIPEIEGSRVTVEAVYKMWLSLECAMIRRESLIIVEDPALAHVTKLRTEQWRLMNRLIVWGSTVSIIFATILPRHPTLYMFPFCMAFYGFGMLQAMNQRDPASKYSECCINKQFEQDPDSHTVCDAQISLRYLRSPKYRMFKLEDHRALKKTNMRLIGGAIASGMVALVRKVYNFNYSHPLIKVGYEVPKPIKPLPLNIFKQIQRGFFTFGNAPEPGRVDLIHWIIQTSLFYYFFLRHAPWLIQTCLEYLEREHVLEISIRYLQFRNLQGEERYEFPARNLYRTMQKDFPKNRVLKELYEHYDNPPEGYYESEEFLSSREYKKLTLIRALQRWRLAYSRKW